MVGGWWVLGGVCSLHSHFHVQPNYSVEVVLWLCCVVIGVVTTTLKVMPSSCSSCYCDSEKGKTKSTLSHLDLCILGLEFNNNVCGFSYLWFIMRLLKQALLVINLI